MYRVMRERYKIGFAGRMIIVSTAGEENKVPLSSLDCGEERGTGTAPHPYPSHDLLATALATTVPSLKQVLLPPYLHLYS